MSTIVILPGGFHPYHAGHFSLYQAAKKKFPNADVYVAATNDQSERPFPFQLKEKLATLAGVEKGHFIQVKSPFQAKEITSHYNPETDVLIFVRSEKDRNEQPKPGGVKKDGTPAYFQPWTGKNIQPFSKHAYIDYLPTVEFGPGITSATQIRKAWPTLNDKRKTALVMSLYPVTQKNPKLAQNVVGMFDQVMGNEPVVNEGLLWDDTDKKLSIDQRLSILEEYYSSETKNLLESNDSDLSEYFLKLVKASKEPKINKKYLMICLSLMNNKIIQLRNPEEILVLSKQDHGYLVKLSDGTTDTFPSKRIKEKVITSSFFFDDKNTYDKFRSIMSLKFDYNISDFENYVDTDLKETKSKVIKKTANDLINGPKIMKHRAKRDKDRQEEYKQTQYRNDDEDDSFPKDAETQQLLRYAQQHYPSMPNKQQAFVKYVQRALKHSEESDKEQDIEIKNLYNEVEKLKQIINKPNVAESIDYLEEK